LKEGRHLIKQYRWRYAKYCEEVHFQYTLMVQMEMNMADFANLLGDADEADSYREAAGARKEAINSLLWNQTSGEIYISSPIHPAALTLWIWNDVTP
jgi:hypothetical protein